MQGNFWHQFLIQIFMLFHMVAFILFSIAAVITAYFKDSDWLLKIFYRGHHVKEYNKLDDKVTMHFVRGRLSRKQTVARSQGKTKTFADWIWNS